MTLGPTIIILIALTFLLAGTVKGVIGLGLPTVSLGLLTAALDLPTAMALLIIPSLATNVVQASVGGNASTIIKRIWPFLLMATATVWIGATALTSVNLNILSCLLGLLLLSYATMNLAGIKFVIPVRRERLVGPVFGAANGILTGMTGSFVVPGVMFLQAIGMPRDMLIQAMGMLFTVSTLALALALQANNLMTGTLSSASALALVPALIGVFAGQAIRSRLSEALFRQIFFVSILILGLYITLKAVI